MDRGHLRLRVMGDGSRWEARWKGRINMGRESRRDFVRSICVGVNGGDNAPEKILSLAVRGRITIDGSKQNTCTRELRMSTPFP